MDCAFPAMRNSRFGIALALTILAVSASPALAGQKHGSPKTGEEVIVTQSASGDELRGRLVELSPSSLAILVEGGRVDVPIDNDVRIDVRNDSLKNGAIIGASVMGGLSLLGCANLGSAGWCAYGVTMNAALGAFIGAGIDAMHKGRTPIYIKAGKSEKAVGVTLRF